MGNNVNGLQGKQESMSNMVKELNAAIIMFQKTKLYRPGKVNIEGFEVFEKHVTKEKVEDC